MAHGKITTDPFEVRSGFCKEVVTSVYHGDLPPPPLARFWRRFRVMKKSVVIDLNVVERVVQLVEISH